MNLRRGCRMNTLTMIAGASLIPGLATLLVLRLLRDRIGEMPRLLVSPLLGFGAYVAASNLLVRWTDIGLPSDWYPTGLLMSGLWATMVIVWAADEGRDLAPEDRTAPPHWPTGLLGRHWRGELPLWAAFWIICVWLIPLIRSSFSSIVATLDLDLSIDEDAFEITASVLGAVELCLIGWALVGLRNAARRRRAATEGKGFGAHLARGLAALSVVGLVLLAVAVTVRVGSELQQYNLLFTEAENVRPAEIRAVRGGREIIIDGDFTAGIARRFGLLLIEARKARVVHLNSPGGSMNEAYRLAVLIRRRGLETYVSDKCYSACTLAFAAGKRRWVSEEANFIFHSPKVTFLSSLGIPHDRIQAHIAGEYFRALDVDPGLIAEIRHTPFTGFLEPTPEELRRYRFTTDTADDDRFAASAWAISDWPSAATFVKQHYPILETAAERNPEVFEAIVEEMRRNYEAGASPSEIFSAIRTRVNGLVEQAIDDAAK